MNVAMVFRISFEGPANSCKVIGSRRAMMNDRGNGRESDLFEGSRITHSRKTGAAKINRARNIGCNLIIEPVDDGSRQVKGSVDGLVKHYGFLHAPMMQRGDLEWVSGLIATVRSITVVTGRAANYPDRAAYDSTRDTLK
jgi:hypothetical protein